MGAHGYGRTRFSRPAAMLLLCACLGIALARGQATRAQGVVIGGCNIVQFTQCPNADMSGANLSNYNLTAANLYGAKFRSDTLDGTDFSYAYMQGVDFTNATLNGVNFTAAVLAGADMSGAKLTNITWVYTMCPDGTTSEQDGGTCSDHLGAAASGASESPRTAPRSDNAPTPAAHAECTATADPSCP